MLKSFLLGFYLLLIALAIPPQAEAAFSVPRLTGPIVDQARLFRNQDIEGLEKWLLEIKARGKVQIQIVTLESLQELTIEEASIRIADQWKIGGAKTDKGLIFVVAPKERKMRLEVGQGLEGDLPDVFAKRIVSDTMAPYFRKGEYEQGIIAAVEAALLKVDPDALTQDGYHDVSTKRKAGALSIRLLILLVILIFLISLIGGGGGPGRRWRRRGNDVFWGGLGGYSAGSSSGWSGGGGGFSGGGASGSW